MIIDFNIDYDKGMVDVTEETEYGTRKNKVISLDDFLQVYTSYIKEKEDKYEFLFLPPGTVEYRKNVNSLTFFIETYPYKEYYGVEGCEFDYAVIMNTDSSGNKVTSFSVFVTKGAFNKYFSSFHKIYESQKSFSISSESEGIKKCLSFCKEISLTNVSLSLKYKNIM